MPILLELGGRLLGLNVDPDFSNVLYVLVMLNLAHTARYILGRYMGAEGAETLLARSRQGAADTS